MTLPAETFREKSFVPDATNQRLLRDALGCFATGVAIVTIAASNGPLAITVNSFSSVSLTPPLVLWSLDRRCSQFAKFSSAMHYSIHVLHSHQETLCMNVARDAGHLQAQHLAINAFNVPVLDECLVRFDCTREFVHEAGDHVIILGKIDLATLTGCEADLHEPLAFYRGSTGSFNSECKTYRENL